MPPIDQLAAEQFASQSAPPEVVGLFEPIMEIIKPAIGTVSAIVGGLFGLYLIFVIVRLYYERRKIKLLRNINYDLDYLNQHFNLPYSREKKTPRKVMPLSELRRLMKEKAKKQKEKNQARKGRRFFRSDKLPISIKVKGK
jgi:hypothetical protein